jgi:hypothetical protein
MMLDFLLAQKNIPLTCVRLRALFERLMLLDMEGATIWLLTLPCIRICGVSYFSLSSAFSLLSEYYCFYRVLTLSEC